MKEQNLEIVRRALNEIEWELDYREDLACPWCRNEKHEGHTADCLRELAVAQLDRENE